MVQTMYPTKDALKKRIKEIFPMEEDQKEFSEILRPEAKFNQED